MELQYKVKIENPLINQVEVRIFGIRSKKVPRLRFYIPTYCPGELTLKNYAKNIHGLMVTTKMGEILTFERVGQNSWEILFNETEIKKNSEEFIIQYRVSCKGKPPFYSFVDVTSAYLLGASILMGVEFSSKFNLTLEFPALWSKINTSLEDVSNESNKFVYSAPDFETLLSTPILIGCHETDGFRAKGGDHFLSFNREFGQLKSDLVKIITSLEGLMGPHHFPKYHFIFDFFSLRNCYFGFSNSAVFLLDGKKIKSRKNYIKFLFRLTSAYLRSYQEIIEGQNFSKETHSNFLWVREGMESFLSPLILMKAKIISQKELVDVFLEKIVFYTDMSGKYYQDLSDCSFSQWQRSSDSNFKVNRASKGFILFLVLYSGLSKDRVKSLTNNIYKKPYKIFLLLQEMGFDKIETFALTTEDLDFFSALKSMGLVIKKSKDSDPYLGCQTEGMIVKNCILGGPFYKAGILRGDEILKIDSRKAKTQFINTLKPQKYYRFTIRRDLRLLEAEVLVENKTEKISSLFCEDPIKFKKFLKGF